jgi:hypothetical protein
MTTFYDRAGRPLEMLEWAELFETDRRVADDYLIVDGEPVRVSTIWFGYDMRYEMLGVGAPLIFETMTFSHAEPLHEWCERWPTEVAALAGHERIVAELTDSEARRREGRG